MSKILEAIAHEYEAADKLLRACTRLGARLDAENHVSPFTQALRKQFVTASMTPDDMIATLGKIR